MTIKALLDLAVRLEETADYASYHQGQAAADALHHAALHLVGLARIESQAAA